MHPPLFQAHPLCREVRGVAGGQRSETSVPTEIDPAIAHSSPPTLLSPRSSARTQEVETLVRCHEERSVAKFFNACGPAKLALDACFREEKVLRKRLNHRVPEDLPPMLRRGSTEGSVEGAGGSVRTSS